MQRRDFRDSSGAKPGSIFPLNELWIPIQSEVNGTATDFLAFLLMPIVATSLIVTLPNPRGEWRGLWA